MKIEPVDLNKLFLETYEELRPAYGKRNIEFNLGDLPKTKGDVNMLKHLIGNLLSNALKYTGKKEKAVINVGTNSNNEKLEIYIEDNGAGFDEKYCDRLFEAFRRLHNNKDFEGTGIGLAIALKVINYHEGKIKAKGEINKGATFYFSLWTN